MVRPTTEEFNLAANAHEHDVRNAEFIRTYMSQDFFGGQLLRRLETAETAAESSTSLRRIRARKDNVEDADIYMRLFPESYGLRGRDLKVHFLSPWEFVMFWDVLRLRPPPLDADDPKAVLCLTAWVAKGTFWSNPNR